MSKDFTALSTSNNNDPFKTKKNCKEICYLFHNLRDKLQSSNNYQNNSNKKKKGEKEKE